MPKPLPVQLLQKETGREGRRHAPARMKQNAKVEFGDFQTPPALAREVCSLLVRQRVKADAVLEPTCGVGAFLSAAGEAFPKARLLGWDINHDYVEQTKLALKQSGAGKRASVGVQDFFTHDWEAGLADIRGSLLVLGNLPWVTNATVCGMNGSNLPTKENFQGFRGIEARTGKSNFDISEWMLIRLVKVLRGRSANIAMLCKTGTGRKLLRFAWQNDGRIAAASLYRIDAKKHFGASVDACLLLAQPVRPGLRRRRCSTVLPPDERPRPLVWPGRTWFSTSARIGDSSTLKDSARISGVPA